MTTSARHQALAATFKLAPELAPWILTRLGAPVPAHSHVRLHDTDAPIAGTTLRPDALVVLENAYLRRDTVRLDDNALLIDVTVAVHPVLGVVTEVQIQKTPEKIFPWRAYPVSAEGELHAPALVLVIVPNPSVHAYYLKKIAEDARYRPGVHVLFCLPEHIPRITDPDEARAFPALAVLSALMHAGTNPVGLFPALLAAMEELPKDHVLLFYDVLRTGLPPAARPLWEAFVQTTAHRYLSRDYREIDRKARAEERKAARAQARQARVEGRAEGRAEGKVDLLLALLRGKNIPVPARAAKKIRACTDEAQVDSWFTRAMTATNLTEILGT